MSPDKTWLSQFSRFTAMGGIAFLVDASILQLLVSVFEVNPYYARIPSAATSIAVSWFLHGRYTFGVKLRTWRSALSHLVSTLITLGINLGIYWLVLSMLVEHPYGPLIALSIASAIGLVFNFLLAKIWVFKE